MTGENPKKSSQRLFWLSFILLFAEILCIRWLGCELRVVRVFPNLIVMVALVSTSAGLIAHSTAKAKNWLDSSFASIIAASILVGTAICSVPTGMFDLTIRLESASPLTIAGTLALLFGIISCLFIIFRKIGVSLGEEFEKHKPLYAYSVNLLGSIAGTLAIGVVSWLSLDAWTWLLTLTISTLFVLKSKKDKIAVILVGAILSLSSIAVYAGSYWSPYSKLTLEPVHKDAVGPGSYALLSNNKYFHTGLNILSEEKEKEFLSSTPQNIATETVKYYYRRTRTPFLLVDKLDDVLVLGAGSGNDVACALRSGAKSVDAVEIDPVIASFGNTIHPNKPWKDPRVKIHTEDARTFLRYAKNKYDLVLFADLDPGSTINSSSFLRVDNFVYTEESIRAALRVLKPDGVVVLSYATGPDNFITERLYNTILGAYRGDESLPRPMNLFAYVDEKWESVIFIFGPGAKQPLPETLVSASRGLTPWPEEGKVFDTRPATDNWPFLFTRWHISGMILYFSVLLVAVVVPAILAILRLPGAVKVDSVEQISPGQWGNMFFLGQAFMLIETKSITQLSLLFGATWLVSSIVILTILVLAWLANLAVIKVKRIPILFLYAGLLVTSIIDYLYKVPEQTALSPLMIGLIASLVACGPILFGSMTFSRCFRDTRFPLHLLSANLLGVAFGGLTENLSLWFGLKSLPIIGFVLYALSGICLLIHHSRAKENPGHTVREPSLEE